MFGFLNVFLFVCVLCSPLMVFRYTGQVNHLKLILNSVTVKELKPFFVRSSAIS